MIITANQASVADSFWLRAIPQEACSENGSVDNIKGVVYYGDSPSVPKTDQFPFTDSCDDETPRLVPHVSKKVQPPGWRSIEDVSLGRNDDNFFRWYLNNTTLRVYWDDPTLQQIYNRHTHFPESSNVVQLPNADEWVYLVINHTFPITHPIHLHGHDFFILAQGLNLWDGSINTDNPPRRDTALLPPGGHLIIGFITDNPGAWLMHCHIGWHTTEGFALQFVERESEIRDLIHPQELHSTCRTWKRYDRSHGIVQMDDGI